VTDDLGDDMRKLQMSLAKCAVFASIQFINTAPDSPLQRVLDLLQALTESGLDLVEALGETRELLDKAVNEVMARTAREGTSIRAVALRASPSPNAAPPSLVRTELNRIEPNRYRPTPPTAAASSAPPSIVDDLVGGLSVFMDAQRALDRHGLAVPIRPRLRGRVRRKGAGQRRPPRLVPCGQTSLLDPIMRSVADIWARIEDKPTAERPDTVLFWIITDGHENPSARSPMTR
jgi:hypothetical protein